MKRKKIALLIIVAVLFFYCVSAALTFILIYTVRISSGTEAEHKMSSAYAQTLRRAAENGGLEALKTRLAADCPQSIGAAYSWPYIYAVFDASGVRVDTRGVTLDWYADTGGAYVSRLHLDISPLLTRDTRASLQAFIKKSREHAVDARSISLAQTENGWVPTAVTLVSLFDPRSTLTLPLSDEPPTRTVDCFDDDNNILHLDLFSLAAGRDQKRCARLREIVNEFEAQANADGDFASAARLSQEIGTKAFNVSFPENDAPAWAFFTRDFIQWEVHAAPAADQTYYVFFAALGNPAQDVLFSANFGVMAGLLALLFAAAGAGLILFIDRTVKAREKQLAARRALTDAAAHELKTPLAVILNQTECLAENVAPEKQGAYIDSVRAEALRMNEIVTDLTRFNRLSDQKTTEKTACDLCAILRAEAEKYRAFAESAGVTLTLSLPESFTVNGNADMLALAVDNYLSNAVKYAEGAKQVCVTLKTRGRHFRLEVYNDCVPLSAKERKRVWNVLSRGDKARARSGASTGLGLPTCAAVFRLHRFSYGCRAEAGGMVFWFRK